MKLRSGPIIQVALFLLLIAAARVRAVDGDVVYTFGQVLVHRSSEVLPAEIGMPVGEGDVIETARDGVAVISLVDGAEIKLRENTTLSLDSLGRNVAVHLSSGSVFSRVNRQLISGFSVQTETAVMGVRGTEFFVAYGRKIDRYRDVWICVNTGSVEVAVLETRDTLIVEAGKGINILGGTNLTTPQRYPWTRKLNWNMDPASGAIEDRTDLEQAYSDLLDQDYD
ncbi:MAG: FecR domain-containing protein [Spirochaetaceae bacterium]|nr:MAG: FecR domain-containing protein [Spirochaetaceae bacterium]